MYLVFDCDCDGLYSILSYFAMIISISISFGSC